MADTDPEVKGSGTSKAVYITIVTALITAGTTISVAYINRAQPAPVVNPDPPSPKSAPDNDREAPPAPDPVVDEEPVIPPQQLMQTTRNVAGLWNAQGGEQMEIAQTGSQLVVSGGVMTEAGVIVWQGYGRITDRKLSWTAQAAANGNQVEIECTGRLTTSGNSIQGVCDILGQQQAFQYTR